MPLVALQLTRADYYRKIPIALIDTQKGEHKAQACENACVY